MGERLSCRSPAQAERLKQQKRQEKNSADAVFKLAAVLYEVTEKEIADRRLPGACRILNERLPWASEETTVSRPVEASPPVRTETPEKIRRREEAFRQARFGGFRA